MSAPRATAAWTVEVEPTNLIALWPCEMPPGADDVARRLGATRKELSVDDRAILWCSAFEWPARGEPIVVWVERAREHDPRELEQLGLTGGAGQPPGAWALGAEVLLDADDAPVDFADLLHRLASALPETPAILDVNTGRWFPTSAFERIFGPHGSEPAEPPAETLWIVESSGAGPIVSLRTRGLARCGRPEVEIIDVARDMADPAAILLDAVAERFIEEGVPPPGSFFDVAPGLAVAVRAREAETPSVAVLCDRDSLDRAETRLSWPRDVIDRIARGEVALYLSSRTTERQASLARAGWDALVRLVAGAGAEATSIRVQVAFAVATSDAPGSRQDRCGNGSSAEDREHLWFEAETLDERGFVGVLLHAPALIETLAPGDRARLSRESVSDFEVLTSSGRYGPRDLLDSR